MQHHKEYGLIGNPLAHSFSEKYFNQKFKREGIDAEYINFELPDIGDLMELLSESPALMGFNVTAPFKQQIIPYLDELSGEATLTGAVNVVKIERDDNGDIVRLIGHNTDYGAFKHTLTELICCSQPQALILGTGGAAKAVAASFNDLGINFVNVSRKPTEGQIGYHNLDKDILDTHFIVVNATPLGTYPNVDTSPAIPYNLLSGAHLCYDLVYNPSVTAFMRQCAAQGATVKNGLEMLLLQAQYSWDIWNA